MLGGVREGDRGSAQEHAPQPDASRLATLAAEFVAAGLPVRLTVAGTPSTDPGLGLTVYRIVQESLTNVLRHAKRVGSVTVTVTWTEGEVTILVRDAGALIPPGSEEGRGILGIRERVALYDGTIETGPHAEGGWRVFARLRSGESQL